MSRPAWGDAKDGEGRGITRGAVSTAGVVCITDVGE